MSRLLQVLVMGGLIVLAKRLWDHEWMLAAFTVGVLLVPSVLIAILEHRRTDDKPA